MESVIARTRSPEEEELEKKLAELAVMEAELTERELDLATLQADLNNFEQEYQRVVGVRYLELNKIEAQITKYLGFLKLKEPQSQKQVEQIGTKTIPSPQTIREILINGNSKNSKPPERLKQLYRELARKIHPDFTTDKAECLRRHDLMAEVNQAYESGNEAKLEAMLNKWQHSPELVTGEGIGADLIRSIRKIAQVREQLKEIDLAIKALKRSSLYQLSERVITAQYEGRDLLTEMALQVEQVILETKMRLEALTARLGKWGMG